MQILKKCIAVFLCLAVFTGQAAALSPAERFQRAAAIINLRGLVAETHPITQETIAQSTAYLEEHPEALADILNDILGGMDTHSMYLTAKEYQAGFSTLSGYAGIGVAISQDEQGVFIRQVVRHSPAATAGMQVGDRLLTVDGKNVRETTLTEIGALLQGEAGTPVQITVSREGKEFSFRMKREKILEETVAARQAAPGVEYISISAFSSMNDAEDFAEIWNGLDEKKTNAVILDLRDNGGGMVDAAFSMLDLMLEKPGKMATMHYRESLGGDEVYEASGGGLPLRKMIVLVGPNTASAAELMAGVLHEVGGAVLMGAQTYGKGQGQYHLQIDGDYLVLTCLEMRLPKSGGWEGVGLKPDIEAHTLRTIRGYLKTAAPLDVQTPVIYGQQSAQVRAVCERLHALGYLAEPSDILDTRAFGALRRFQLDAGLDTQLGADEATLRALDIMTKRAAERGLMIDDVYYAALRACQEAAAQPLRYQPQADGSWRSAA